MTHLDTLRQKYDRFIRSGNHVKALQVMQEIARLSAVHETVERTKERTDQVNIAATVYAAEIKPHIIFTEITGNRERCTVPKTAVVF